MIRVSEKSRDWAFVRDVITERGLSPRPDTGFHFYDDYWAEDADHLRVIERYPWGAVVCVEDRIARRGATLVIEGEFDAESGMVAAEEAEENVADVVPWYGEVAGRAIGRAARPESRVPPCLGNHDAQAVCDGGLNSTTQMIEAPCGWMAICIGFQSYCADKQVDPEMELKGMSPADALQKLRECARPVAKRTSGGPSNGEVVVEHRNIVPDRAAGPPIPGRQTARQVTADLLREFWLALDKAVKPQHRLRGVDAVTDADGAVRAGDPVVVDRLSSSNHYCYLYCEPPRLKLGPRGRIALATVTPRPMTRSLQVQVVAPVAEVEAALTKYANDIQFKVREVKDGGAFKSSIGGIGDVAAVAAVVELMRQQSLPEVWREVDRRRRWAKPSTAARKKQSSDRRKQAVKTKPKPPRPVVDLPKEW